MMGIFLILFSCFGYFTIADEFRHLGEFMGITGSLFAGLILLVVESGYRISRLLALQWLSFGILIGIPLGGIILDNMIMGIIAGFCFGIFLAFLLRTKN